ncbi:DUF2851 family protein [Pedobacter insulae]|uniref:DUF2851 domain-containing protein n=1 Tax=Pedobacter insulae TaxID=414048 RepID=A0A1I3A912_9SPHI|nr:DUF2851 family protein [Pedobacter insulae]SFH46603.1 Protein of unknown function [Pedobacter insulae]
MRFPEEFLHFIWRFKLYGVDQLYTEAAELIEVIQCGTLNKNAGPDFLHAKLVVDGTVWVGSIEIHLNASDWLVHQHQHDAAYDNVILHIVYVNDRPIYRTDGTLIPVLVIKGRFPIALLTNYEQLILSANNFPCEKQVKEVDGLFVENFLTRVAIERLVCKSQDVYDQLNALKGDWDETFYHFMAKNFGFKINAAPMEMLARSLPQQILARHKDNSLQIEALLFGQAGFLAQKFTDDYPQRLKREYRFLKRKYRLNSVDTSLWKFMRMRPQNFPTLRLAQFAALIINSNHLFSKIIIIKDYKMIVQLFEHLPVNAYWKTHYHFNKATENVNLQLGKESIDNILINTLSLFLFAYGKYIDQYMLVNRAIELQEKLPAEHNVIIKQYVDAGVQVKSAYFSQALLQLRRSYCSSKKCLNCGIGVKLLNRP